MTPGWLINRLKLMSAGEVLYRFRQSATSSLERFRLRYGWEPQTPHPVTTRLKIFGNAHVQGLVVPDESSATISLQAGRLSLFEYEGLEVGWPINWHREPLTGVVSPALQYGKSINYRNDKEVGDIKVLWELGRQQFLVPIAIEYYENREKSTLDVITGVLKSWLQQNPHGYGVHWCSSLEVAIRGVSWAITHQFLLATGLPKGIFSLDLDISALEKQVFQHAHFIRGHLSLYSSANNHLVGELTGLHVLCSLFQFGKKSDDWRDFAWQSLQTELKLQVYEDGVDKEQAIYYHCWVLEYYLINYLVASHNRVELPEIFTTQLSCMAQFIQDLSPMGAPPPQIGDADDGIAIQFSPVKSSFYDDLINTVNALAGVEPAAAPGSKAFWYRSFLKEEGCRRLVPVTSTSYPASYPQGGYAILGKPQFHVVFDCGPLGYPSIAAHGHADMLNTCLAIDGTWWLADPGTFSYHSDHQWRDYFRGSRAHNVLSINQRDQSEIGGPFMWIKRANAHFEGVNYGDEVQSASGWHDGYTAEGAPRVHRLLEVNPDTEQLTIIDQVECIQKFDLDLSFHFLPDITYVEQQGNSILLKKTGSPVGLKIDFPEELSLKFLRGDVDTPCGWYSSALGKKEPCLTIRASIKLAKPAKFTSIMTVIREA
jgi:hypothetical protein